MTGQSNFEDDLRWAIDQTGITGNDRTLILTGAWTIDQIPKIETEAQARIYREVERRLKESWRAKGKDALSELAQSGVGTLANAYGVRILEWEDHDYLEED